MSHRAAVYTVKVRYRGKPGSEGCPLGDIDNAGTALIAELNSYLKDFTSKAEDDSKVVSCTDCQINGDELEVVMQHGQNGVAADIIDPDGNLRIRQVPEDTQLLRCGCLFRLPKSQHIGWLVVHINNRRSVKGLLENGLKEKLRANFPDLVLEIVPCVQSSVLMEAVRNNQIDKVKLVKIEQPSDRASAAINKWIQTGIFGRLELSISPRGKGTHILTDLLTRFFADESERVFQQIVEFGGMTFDEAKVEVVLENKIKRTFNIEKPDSGHAFTVDLPDLTIENDEPTPDSIFEGLRSTLNEIETP